MLRVLLILALCLPMLGAEKFLGFAPAVAPPTDQYFADTFSGDLSAWSDTTNWSIDAGELEVSNQDSIIYSTATTTIKQWTCAQLVATSGVYPGPQLRHDSTTASVGISYAFRAELGSSVQFRSCNNGPTCNDVGPDISNEMDAGDWICFEVEGTGTNTIMRGWDMSTTDPCQGGGTTPDDFGDPTACLDNTGDDISGCNCAGGTSCYDSMAVACSDTPCMDGAAGRDLAECSGANCYVALYTGNSSLTNFDNFCGGSTEGRYEFFDDFNRATSDSMGAEWTEDVGDWDIGTNEGEGHHDAEGNESLLRHNTQLGSPDQCVCVTHTDNCTGGGCGVVLRGNSPLESGALLSGMLWISTGVYYIVDYATGDWQSDLYSYNGTGKPTDTDRVCVAIVGGTSSTAADDLKMWVNPTTDCEGTCTVGLSGDGCTYTWTTESGWAANAYTTWDQKYIGLTIQSSGTATFNFDDFYAEAD